jgi:hypothetical protein
MAAHQHDHPSPSDVDDLGFPMRPPPLLGTDRPNLHTPPDEAERVLVQAIEELVERLGDDRTSRGTRVIIADQLRTSSLALWAILSHPSVADPVT